MIETFQSGGVIMWPLLVLAVGVVALIGREALRRRRATIRATTRSAAPSTGSPENAGTGPVPAGRGATILFWGGTAAVLGLLGTVVGLLQMAHAIQRAGSTTPQLVWGGVGVSLVSLIFGLLILLVAGLGWLAFRNGGAGAGRSGARRLEA